MSKFEALPDCTPVTYFIMRFLDVLIIFFSGVITFKLTQHADHLPDNYLLAIVCAVTISIIICPLSGIYSVRRSSAVLEEIKTLWLSWNSLFIVLIGLAFLFKRSADFSRVWVFSWYLFGFILWISGRIIVRFTLKKIRQISYNQKTIAIVGAGMLAKKTAITLTKAHWFGFVVKGFYRLVDENESTQGVPEEKISGNVNALLADIEKGEIDQVWIALPSTQSKIISQIIQLLNVTAVDIRLIPDLLQTQLINHSVSFIDDLSVINLCMTPMRGINKFIKILEDKILAFLILLMISPVMLVVAVIIKLTSPGPVFFKQLRHGFNGKPFQVYKFRSMKIHHEKQNVVTQAKRNDGRTTYFGALLRRTSLDELPQFINVLKGEMSIVGPRPHAISHNDQYKHSINAYMKRHKVKPGITGLAQIKGYRGETDTHEKMENRVKYDMYYIKNWSLWIDIKIILLTIFKGFINKNSY